jgi:predicted nucleic acid-binding protein
VRLALDTNILAYAEGINGAERHEQTLELISRVPQDACIIPAQALGELFNVLVRKAGKTKAEAREALLAWHDAFPTAQTAPETVLLAADLAVDHDFSIWDAVIFATASQAGCRLLLSEDMHDGFTWGAVTIVNPFSKTPSPILEALLGGAP